VKSKSTVRAFDVFNDITAGFASDNAWAEVIYHSAAEAVARHAGPIMLSPVRGVHIPLGDRPINLFNFSLPSGPHSILLTRRRLVDLNDDTVHLSGGGVFPFQDQPNGARTPGTVASQTKSIISDHANLTDESLKLLAAHEMAHSFMGPGVCLNTACTMQAPEPENVPRNAEILAQEEPFCDNCIGTLEYRGQQAAGVLLLDGLNFNE
jgi:hypothetical protein